MIPAQAIALLRRRNADPKREWIEQILQENPQVTAEDLFKRLVASDLAVSCNPRIPADSLASDTIVTELPTTVLLQVVSILNVSESSHSQMEAVRAKDPAQPSYLDSLPPTFPGTSANHRLFKYKLMDGDRVLIGMELKPLPLQLNTAPGCKIVVNRGCPIRRGVLVMTPEYVQVVGGKVDALEDQHFIHILELCLGIDEEDSVVPQHVTRAAPETSAAAEDRPDAASHVQMDVRADAGNAQPILVEESPAPRPTQRREQHASSGVAPSRTATSRSVSVRPSPSSRSAASNTAPAPVASIQQKRPHESREPTSQVKRRSVEARTDERQALTPTLPRRVKATCVGFLSKLRVENNLWTIDFKLQPADSSPSFSARATSELLQETIGLTVAQFKTLKSQMKTKPELKVKLSKQLETVVKRFANATAVFHIDDTASAPQVVGIEEDLA